jgi:hypothetical protein
MIGMSGPAKVIPFIRPSAPPPAESSELVAVRRCRHQAEALVVRGLLESQGIPTAFRSRLAQSVHPFSVGGQAESVVLVPASMAELAKSILTGRWVFPTNRSKVTELDVKRAGSRKGGPRSASRSRPAPPG